MKGLPRPNKSIKLLALCNFICLMSACDSKPALSTDKNVAANARTAISIDEPTAKKLLKASQQEKAHPGLILRFSCQIPRTSSLYVSAQREVVRAERLFDTVIAKEVRFETARSLQDSYYSAGKKISVRVREGKTPTLIMTYVLFNETTAYQATADGLSKTIGDTFLPLGIGRVDYESGYGEGSFSTWEPEQVHKAEFGKMEALCEDVRDGKQSPDAINATVQNPK